MRGPDIALDPTDRQREAAKDRRIAELKSELADARATIEALESRLEREGE